MITITKERLLTIKQWRETYGPGSNVVLPAEEAEELARIVLTSLEAEAPSLPGGFTIKEAKELHKNLVKSHVSKALSGEKMKKENRNADLRWIHDVIVRAAWFVKASLEQNTLTGNYPATPDSWISCSERMPNDKQYVWCWGKSYGWAECNTFEGYYDWSRNKWWAVTDDGEEPASKVTHWMPLPEPPQEAK
ncbi:TPA: DUF551 domain-containing protein [Escherichia coli]|nr:DUF551 domain-containing protein [Escherichia coli]